jgi:hypothetical protein
MARIKYIGPESSSESDNPDNSSPSGEVNQTSPGEETSGQDDASKTGETHQPVFSAQLRRAEGGPSGADTSNHGNTQRRFGFIHYPGNGLQSRRTTTEDEARSMPSAGLTTVRGRVGNNAAPSGTPSRVPSSGSDFVTASHFISQVRTGTLTQNHQASRSPDDNAPSDSAMGNQPQTMLGMTDRNQVRNTAGASAAGGLQFSSSGKMLPRPTPVPIRSGPSNRNKRARLSDENSEDDDTANPRYLPQQEFSILRAIVRHPQLVFHFANYLRVDELVSLYAISKEFHDMINTHLTTVILSQAIRRAPHSARIFPFRCYRKLCIGDPMGTRNPANPEEVRLIASFRWLRMALWRDSVVVKIMKLLANDGFGVPKHCELVIKKIWFLMDIPDNARRIGTIQNRQLWSDTDLFFATVFLVKLDMRFTHAMRGNGRDGMRRLLLAQPTLSLLWKVLTRVALQTPHDALQAFVRWKYHATHEEAQNYIFGVAPDEVGKMQYEGYGKVGSMARIQRPDELILKECVRRGLDMERHYFDIINWNYNLSIAVQTRSRPAALTPHTPQIDEEPSDQFSATAEPMEGIML